MNIDEYNQSSFDVLLDQIVDVPNLPFQDDKGFYLFAIEKVQALVNKTLETYGQQGIVLKLEKFKMGEIEDKK